MVNLEQQGFISPWANTIVTHRRASSKNWVPQFPKLGARMRDNSSKEWTPDSTFPTSRSPTGSSRSWSDAATSSKRDRFAVQTPSPLRLNTLYDPIAQATRERRRRRAEILDMPLPDIPSEPPKPSEPATKERPRGSFSDKPVQYRPQEIYSHLFEVADREIRRSSVGSSDILDETFSELSVSTIDVPTEAQIPLGAVHSIIHSHRYREKLSKMLSLKSTTGEVPNDAKVFEATAKDEQKVADLFELVMSDREEEDIALSLRGRDAESFMDALQHVRCLL
ncbi:hypothetical protein PQX77_001704 [Marasmius sp. AFHP31]|nr:hypothetical protein PQX77_001704 [Marasmius sp. AFHP31]